MTYKIKIIMRDDYDMEIMSDIPVIDMDLDGQFITFESGETKTVTLRAEDVECITCCEKEEDTSEHGAADAA
jgi:hypothetical protein